MASSVSNTAKSVVGTDDVVVDEPSMEEILASIKKIIADDEQADDDGKTERERYTHPTDHSNSNVADDDVEERLRLAMESEMLQMGGSNAPIAVSRVNPSSEPEAELSLEEKAAKVRAEVAAAGQGMSSDERLEKYRQRSKLKMETLAAERAEQRAAEQKAAESKKAEIDRQAKIEASSPAPQPVAPLPTPAAVTPAPAQPPVQPSAPVAPAPRMAAPVRQPYVSPVQPAFVPYSAPAASGPTTNQVASEMATRLLAEQKGDIHAMLSELMRPTIRQWLSDNLPSLVEKLVREEIERVSRGKKAS